jgi:hypothetical protein
MSSNLRWDHSAGPERACKRVQGRWGNGGWREIQTAVSHAVAGLKLPAAVSGSNATEFDDEMTPQRAVNLRKQELRRGWAT